jgi:hypothetical protein
MKVGFLISEVPGHEGVCQHTWLNRNQVCTRFDGGITGFFRLVKKVRWWPWLVKYGEKFHGIIQGHKVFTTVGRFL